MHYVVAVVCRRCRAFALRASCHLTIPALFLEPRMLEARETMTKPPGRSGHCFAEADKASGHPIPKPTGFTRKLGVEGGAGLASTRVGITPNSTRTVEELQATLLKW